MAEADRKLYDGIRALKDGRKAEARRLLKDAVRLAPSSWKAWLWLSRSAESEEDQRSCLEKALKLNPRAELAQRELDALGGPHRPIAEVPSQPVAILAEMLREQRKQAATLNKLLRQQEHLVSSLNAVVWAARVWLLLVAPGIVLGCISVLAGSSLLF